jgi:hypothetical protein
MEDGEVSMSSDLSSLHEDELFYSFMDMVMRRSPSCTLREMRERDLREKQLKEWSTESWTRLDRPNRISSGVSATVKETVVTSRRVVRKPQKPRKQSTPCKVSQEESQEESVKSNPVYWNSAGFPY